MTTVAIVYHSGFGHTRVQAEAVRDGAASDPRHDRPPRSRRGSRAALERDRRRRRDRLRRADLHGRRVRTVQGLPRRHLRALGRAAVEEQARRRVHQLRRSERRQARHPAAVRAVRDAAQHDLGRARAASRQPHHSRVARRPQPSCRVPRRDGAVQRRPRPRARPAARRSSNRRTLGSPSRRGCRTLAPPARRRSPKRSHERRTRIRRSSRGRVRRGDTAAVLRWAVQQRHRTARPGVPPPGHLRVGDGGRPRADVDGRVPRRWSMPARPQRREASDAPTTCCRSTSPDP